MYLAARPRVAIDLDNPETHHEGQDADGGQPTGESIHGDSLIRHGARICAPAHAVSLRPLGKLDGAEVGVGSRPSPIATGPTPTG